jgi:2-hydroxychromene-2-carboxylate isomerase
MAKTVDYYLSLISPWAYLGGPRLAEIAARHDAAVNVRPVDLGTIFPQSGGLPLPKRAPQRQAYRMAELKRWREHLAMPLTLEPKFFPAAEAAAAHLVYGAEAAGGDPQRLAQAILAAVWAEERDIADLDTLKAILEETGHDAGLIAKAEDPAMVERRAAATAEALERGVFGSPTYLVDGEVFWGQDRLDFVDRALAG